MQKFGAFLKEFDARLVEYFEKHKEYLCCKKGCSSCCEKGDYPLSELELKYLMQGFISLENEIKIIIQNNFKNFRKGGTCPFLINKECSIYNFRPIICRVHGLAYLIEDNRVKLPYCTNEKKNYYSLYEKGEFIGKPVEENLDTKNVLKDFDYGDIKNLYDWLK